MHKESGKRRQLAVWIEQYSQDVRQGIKLLWTQPSFTAIAALTLGVGIGATTAVFTQVDAVFLRSLPVKAPDELRLFSWTAPVRNFAGPAFGRAWDSRLASGVTIPNFSNAVYRHLRTETTSFSDVACWSEAAATMQDSGRVNIGVVSGNYFQTLGIPAALGRLLQNEDDRPGAGPAVVLSYGFWQRAFAGDRNVLNRTINIRKTVYTIVGVMPQGFFGLNPLTDPDVRITAAAFPLDRGGWTACAGLVGRIKPGISDDQARAEGELLVRQAVKAENPSERVEQLNTFIASGARGVDNLRRTTSLSFVILIIAVSMILLIACANVAGLLLARGVTRKKEISTRFALGATRRRILQQLLTENLVLSMLGGIVGIALAYILNPILPKLLAELGSIGLASTLALNLEVSTMALGFSVALSVVTGVVFGALPGWRSTGGDLASSIKEVASFSSRSHFFSGKTMVGVQVALSMLLLVGAGLFIRTLVNLRSVPIGYDPDGLVFFTADTDARRGTLVRDTLKKLEGMPGVVSAAVSIYPVFTNSGGSSTVCVPGYISKDAEDSLVDAERVSPKFFATWKLPLGMGKEFDDWQAGDNADRSIIINTAFAAKFFPGRNGLHETIGLGPCPGTPFTIIGVAADSTDRPRVKPSPMIYFPYPMSAGTSFATYAVRTSGDLRLIVPSVSLVANQLGTLIRTNVTTGSSYRDLPTTRERVFTVMLTAFGTVAMLLCALGIYGMLVYIVGRRSSEIGLRMALGASRGEVVRMVVQESLVPVALGMAVGLMAALVLTRFVESVLFDVQRNDPVTIAAAVVTVLLIAAASSSLPALRASRIEPIRALRNN